MANLGAVGVRSSAGEAAVAAPTGGVTSINAGMRVVLMLGTWLGLYTPTNTVPAQILFRARRFKRVFP